MGLLDEIRGSLGGALGSISASALPGLVNQVYPGGLPGLLKQLQETGYGQQVDSWLGHGPNDPISAQDLRNALGDQRVKAIEDKLGIPADTVLDALAKALPASVDQHSPNGRLQAPKT